MDYQITTTVLGLLVIALFTLFMVVRSKDKKHYKITQINLDSTVKALEAARTSNKYLFNDLSTANKKIEKLNIEYEKDANTISAYKEKVEQLKNQLTAQTTIADKPQEAEPVKPLKKTKKPYIRKS